MLSFLLLVVMPLRAEYAGLRIANALDHGQGLLQIELDGRSWSDRGMSSGEVSGLRRLQPGGFRLNFVCEGLQERKVTLNLEPGEIVTLIPHAKRMEGGGWAIRVLKLEGREVTSRLASVVYVGLEARLPLEVRQTGASWTPMTLKRMQIERFEIVQPRGYLPMRVGKQRLNSMPVFERGHQVVVVYELKNGKASSLYFRDRGWPKHESGL